MDIYTESSYRTILRQRVEERKAIDPAENFERLAEAMRVPKSYLSKALHNRAELSADQLFLACTHLGFAADERDYIQLLHEASRTALAARKRLLERRVEDVQRAHASAEDYIDAPVVDTGAEGPSEYFLDPWATIVHMALLVPRLRNNLQALAAELSMPRALINRTVALLERHRLVAREKGALKVLVEAMHLPASAGVYRAWRSQLRSLGASRLEATANDDAYAMSVVFAADRKTAHALRLKILELLRDAEPMVRDAPAEGVYQLAVELFPWLTAP